MTDKPKKIFILYDARAASGDTDDASVLVTASTEREARSYIGSFATDSIWFEYDLVKQVAQNENMRPDIKP